MCGCRNGIRAGTACTRTSRSAASCRAALIERSWGNGFVHIKLLDGLPSAPARWPRRASLPATSPATSAANSTTAPLAGLHRYEVAQGFQPAKIECYGDSAEDVIDRASGYMGSAPERIWLSSTVEGWRGPPACWAQWN